MCAADARFAIAKFLLTIGRLLLHCWYSLGRPVTIGTPMVLTVFDDWYSVPFVKNSEKTVKTAKNDYWCTNRHMFTKTVPTVYQSSKTVKRQSKQQKMTIGVPIVTLHRVRRIQKVCVRVRRIHKAVQTPLPCETSITRAWAVATARRPWAGLTVYMDFHASGSHSLSRAARLSSTHL